MAFKIVQTIENGRFVLTTVPDAWESDGALRWPKSNIEILRQNACTVPEESWQTIQCIVRKKGLANFQVAESEIKVINSLSDDFRTSEQRSQMNLTTSFNEFSSLNFSLSQKNMFRTEHSTPDNVMTDWPNDVSQSQQQTMNSRISEHSIVDPIFTRLSTIASNTSSQCGTIESKIDALANIVSGIAQDQTILCQNQEAILSKLVDLSSKIDDLKNKHAYNIYGQTTESLNPLIPKKPFTSLRELEEFEISLKSDQFVKEMTRYYSILISPGKGRGINNAYTIMDTLFDRKFLLEFSWAGGSRTNESKLCFKSYKNTIDFFFKIIHLSDSDFSKMDCDSFIKCVLRNAKKRSESKMMRASHGKRRKPLLRQKDGFILTESDPIAIQIQNESCPADLKEEINSPENSEIDEEDSEYLL